MRSLSLSLFFFFNSSSRSVLSRGDDKQRIIFIFESSEDFSITVSTCAVCRRRRLNFCETTDVARARVSSRFFTFLAFLFRAI